MHKRLLIVTHDYPPIISARAIRWSTLAHYWASSGIQVDVVCAWLAGELKVENLDNLNIYRVNAYWIEMMREWFKLSNYPADASLYSKFHQSRSQIVKRKFTEFAKWIYHNIYERIYWPDGALPWYWPARQQVLRLLRNKQYTALITVSPFFTSHLVGLRVYRKNAKSTWLVDIGDPFCFEKDEAPNNRKLYGKLNYFSEHQVFQRADSISVTTQQTQEKYATLFPECAHKIHVIPPLLTEVPENARQKSFFLDDENIRLVYVGRLYSDLRRPDFLLALFKGLLNTPIGSQIELHFIGHSQQAERSFDPYRNLIGNRIFLHGPLDHALAIQAMREADVLINLGYKTSYRLPSKVVEYCSMGLPILNISQNRSASSSEFFKNFPNVKTIVERVDTNLEDEVTAIYNFIMNLPRPLDGNELQEMLLPYKVESIAESYGRLIGLDSSK